MNTVVPIPRSNRATQETVPFPDAERRGLALARWIDASGGCGLDRSHLEAAASVATLSVDEDGPVFDQTGFGELAEFIAEMPF